MRKIRARKEKEWQSFWEKLMYCVVCSKFEWFNFKLLFPHFMLKRFNQVHFVKWLSNKIWLESHKSFLYVSYQFMTYVFPMPLGCRLPHFQCNSGYYEAYAELIIYIHSLILVTERFDLLIDSLWNLGCINYALT